MIGHFLLKWVITRGKSGEWQPSPHVLKGHNKPAFRDSSIEEDLYSEVLQKGQSEILDHPDHVLTSDQLVTMKWPKGSIFAALYQRPFHIFFFKVPQFYHTCRLRMLMRITV